MAEQSASSRREPTEESNFTCRLCHDSGHVPVLNGEPVAWDDERLLGVLLSCRECQCQSERRREKLFLSSHITDQFLSVGFKGFAVQGRPACVREARDAALEYFDHYEAVKGTKANSCALLGPPGSGKTHLLMAVSNGLMRQGVGVHYFPWVEGFGELKDNLDELESRLDVMRHVDVLFLDDLFKGRYKPTEFQLEQLFGVVNYRYLNCKPMLVSSERDIDEICAIDEGIGRRFWERSKGHRVIMGLTEQERRDGMQLNYSLM